MASLIEAAKRKGLIQENTPSAPSNGRSLVDAAKSRRLIGTSVRQPKQPGLIERVDTATSKVFEPVSNFLFGTTGAVVGGLIGSAGEQLQGRDGVFTQGLQERLGTPGAAAKNIGLTALELFPGGGALKGAARSVGSKLARPIAESAAGQYLRALAPTTKEMKAKAAKVVPELLQRGIGAFSRRGLAETAQSGLARAGAGLEEVIEQIPGKTKIAVGPVLKALSDSKKAFLVPGTRVVAEPKALRAISDVENVVKKLGNRVSFESLRGLRQIWDKTVAKSKGFLMDEVSNFSIMAKREGANAIRKELVKKFPSLEKVNAEYTFWKNLDDVVNATIQRTAGQATPLGARMAETAGAAAGFVKGGVTDAATTALVFRQLSRVLNSTAWNTFSALQKQKLANNLMEGKVADVLTVLSKFVSPTIRDRKDQ